MLRFAANSLSAKIKPTSPVMTIHRCGLQPIRYLLKSSHQIGAVVGSYGLQPIRYLLKLNPTATGP